MHVDSLWHNLQGLDKIIEALSTHKHMNVYTHTIIVQGNIYTLMYNTCTFVKNNVTLHMFEIKVFIEIIHSFC